ncbi:hypothetical protein E2320_006772 [Naja naja]|nr:hypothetical protein E2320_006772 [Naja naja]
MLPLNLCGKYPLNSMEIGDGSSQSWRWHLQNISTPSFVPSSDWVVATLTINLGILATFYYGSFCRKTEISLLHQSRSPLALISQHEWFLSGAEGRRIKPIQDPLLNLTVYTEKGGNADAKVGSSTCFIFTNNQKGPNYVLPSDLCNSKAS